MGGGFDGAGDPGDGYVQLRRDARKYDLLSVIMTLDETRTITEEIFEGAAVPVS